MDNNTIYYVRARHKGAKFGLSEWGPTSHFKTKLALADPSQITSPVSGTTNLLANQTFSIAVFDQGTTAVSIPKIENDVVTGYVSANRHIELVSTEWQLSKTSNFAVVDFTTTTIGSIVDWVVTGLEENTAYYLRVRQNINFVQPVSADAADVVTYTTTTGQTSWSISSIYATVAVFAPRVPNITSPANGAIGIYSTETLASAAFVTDGVSAHQSSDWEISTSASFSTIAFSLYNSTTSLTTATFSGLSPLTTYYARVRHRDASGRVSDYSPATSFSTLSTFAPGQPSITNITNGVSKMGTGWYPVTSSAFAGKGTDTHASSTWQFSTTATFDAGTITSSVTNSASDKTTFSPVGLSYGVTYYARVMHRGESGLDSPWSPVVNFSIVSNSNVYTTQGVFTLTIGAGITQAVLEALGSGGGGAGGNPLAGSSKGGGGGASGQWLTTTIPVVEGDVLTITVRARGNRGVYGTSSGVGGVGGATTIAKNGVTVLNALGGNGGTLTAAGVGSGTGVSGTWPNSYRGGKGGTQSHGGTGGQGGQTLSAVGSNGGQGAGGGGGAAYDSASSSATYGGYGGYGKATITVS